MSSPEVVVVDYGVGNLLSVRRGFESCGARVTVTSDPDTIAAAPRVVLPGVGAFGNGMRELTARSLDEVIRTVARTGTPLFGICLGMQMLLETSEEFGATTGLGIVPGSVIAIPAQGADGAPRKIPHIGWSRLSMAPGRTTWAGTALENVAPGDAMYFVHSFMAEPTDVANRLADCSYEGVAVAAAIVRDNVQGCQFHPEKSGRLGLKILERFLQT